MRRALSLSAVLLLLWVGLALAATNVFYSACPFGTGDIKTGNPTISISGGVATLSVAQKGNIGVGCRITYNTTSICYIAPCRIAFNSGGTSEIAIGDIIRGRTSETIGKVFRVEVASGSWANGDAAGFIYLQSSDGSWVSGETIDRIGPTVVSDIATTASALQGNMSTEFVVLTATGGTPGNVSGQSVDSIAHEYATLNAALSGARDASHLTSANLDTLDVILNIAHYFDHDDYTHDTTQITLNGYTLSDIRIRVFTPTGGALSIRNQRHAGKWDDQKSVLEVSGLSGTPAAVLDMQDRNVHFDGLQIYNNTGESGGGYCVYGAGEADGRNYLENSILRINTADAGYLIDTYLGSSPWTIRNCLGIGDGDGTGARGFILRVAGSRIENCTLVGSQFGRGYWSYGTAGVLTAINCVVRGAADGFYGVFHADSDYNSSSATGDAPVQSPRANNASPWFSGATADSLIFLDPANGDYRLIAGSIFLDVGSTLASVPSDIIGVSRPQGDAYDLGAFEGAYGEEPPPIPPWGEDPASLSDSYEPGNVHYSRSEGRIVNVGGTVLTLVGDGTGESIFRSTDRTNWSEIYSGAGSASAMVTGKNGQVYVFWYYGTSIRMLKFGANVAVEEMPSAVTIHSGFTGNPCGVYQSLSALVDESGNVYLFYLHGDPCRVACLASTDEGANWNSYDVYTDASDYYGPNSTVLSDGTLCVVFSVWGVGNVGTYFSTSTNGGQTWSTPVEVDDVYTSNPSIISDSDDNLYIFAQSSYFDPTGVYFTKSTDGGENWSTWALIEETCGYGDPSAALDADGSTIWLTYRSSYLTGILSGTCGDMSRQVIAYSDDGGQTWEAVWRYYPPAERTGTRAHFNYRRYWNYGGPLEWVWFQYVDEAGSLVCSNYYCYNGDIEILAHPSGGTGSKWNGITPAKWNGVNWSNLKWNGM